MPESTHWGTSPTHGGLTQHRGDRESCLAPDCMDAYASDQTEEVLAEVAGERIRQDEKWGRQDHPDGTGQWQETIDADVARMACQDAAEGGYLDWLHILREEYAEAMAETDPARLRAELLQVAAVACCWVEAIDRRTGMEATGA